MYWDNGMPSLSPGAGGAGHADVGSGAGTGGAGARGLRTRRGGGGPATGSFVCSSRLRFSVSSSAFSSATRRSNACACNKCSDGVLLQSVILLLSNACLEAGKQIVLNVFLFSRLLEVVTQGKRGDARLVTQGKRGDTKK